LPASSGAPTEVSTCVSLRNPNLASSLSPPQDVPHPTNPFRTTAPSLAMGTLLPRPTRNSPPRSPRPPPRRNRPARCPPRPPDIWKAASLHKKFSSLCGVGSAATGSSAKPPPTDPAPGQHTFSPRELGASLTPKLQPCPRHPPAPTASAPRNDWQRRRRVPPPAGKARRPPGPRPHTPSVPRARLRAPRGPATPLCARLPPAARPAPQPSPRPALPAASHGAPRRTPHAHRAPSSPRTPAALRVPAAPDPSSKVTL
jgi:hypothetical protein